MLFLLVFYFLLLLISTYLLTKSIYVVIVLLNWFIIGYYIIRTEKIPRNNFWYLNFLLTPMLLQINYLAYEYGYLLGYFANTIEHILFSMGFVLIYSPIFLSILKIKINSKFIQLVILSFILISLVNLAGISNEIYDFFRYINFYEKNNIAYFDSMSDLINNLIGSTTGTILSIIFNYQLINNR